MATAGRHNSYSTIQIYYIYKLKGYTSVSLTTFGLVINCRCCWTRRVIQRRHFSSSLFTFVHFIKRKSGIQHDNKAPSFPPQPSFACSNSLWAYRKKVPAAEGKKKLLCCLLADVSSTRESLLCFLYRQTRRRYDMYLTTTSFLIFCFAGEWPTRSSRCPR